MLLKKFLEAGPALFQADRGILTGITWEEGKVIPVVKSFYRYMVFAVCSLSGRQKAVFANGEHPYFEMVATMGAQGPTGYGASIMPILPDGRIAMVIEQRSPRSAFDEKMGSRTFTASGKPVNLSPLESLEFPGGAVEVGQSLKSAAVLELAQELGLDDPEITLISSTFSIFHQGADLMSLLHPHIAVLPLGKHADYVDDDGGLRIVTLWPHELEQAMRSGVVDSGQAAWLAWAWANLITDHLFDFDALVKGGDQPSHTIATNIKVR